MLVLHISLNQTKLMIKIEISSTTQIVSSNELNLFNIYVYDSYFTNKKKNDLLTTAFFPTPILFVYTYHSTLV